MKFRLPLLALSLVAAPLPVAAQGAAVDTIPFERIIAVVGAKPILWSEVQTEVNQRVAERRIQLPSDSAGQMALARQVLNEMIDEEVLLKRAEGDTAVKVSESDVTQQVEQQIRRVRGQYRSDQQLVEALRQGGFGNIEEYRRFLSEQSRRNQLIQRLIQKLKADGMLAPMSVSEEDVSEAFEERKASFPRRPATVVFRQVVVPARADSAARAAARAKAESLLVEIRRGGDFELIAKRESMDPTTRELGGDLGWNRRGSMVVEFDRVMFALPPGVVSPVVETPYGFHIIRVDRVQPAEAKARHILIRPAIDSADIAAARVRADSVLAMWRAGVPHDSLVATYHDPDEEKASLAPFPREQLPEAYQRAFEGKGTGDYVEPFELEDRVRQAKKFAVAFIVEAKEGGEYTIADLRNQIRDQLAEERALRRLIDELRRQTYVSVRM